MCNGPKARRVVVVSALRPPLFIPMLSADAEHGHIMKFSYVRRRDFSHGVLPFIPSPLLFRTIRASWSDNDCLVIAGGTQWTFFLVPVQNRRQKWLAKGAAAANCWPRALQRERWQRRFATAFDLRFDHGDHRQLRRRAHLRNDLDQSRPRSGLLCGTRRRKCAALERMPCLFVRSSQVRCSF